MHDFIYYVEKTRIVQLYWLSLETDAISTMLRRHATRLSRHLLCYMTKSTSDMKLMLKYAIFLDIL
jgi:hypothetical protein